MLSRSVVRLSSAVVLAGVLLAANSSLIAAVSAVPVSTTAIDTELVTDHSNSAHADRLYLAGSRAFREGQPERAMHDWHEAALLGHARAQYNVGSGYASGTGLPKDYRRAAYWWGQAAQQGNTDAIYNLGVMNYEGRGMERNYAKAKHWWRLAAIKGDPASMFRLGWLAAAGEGEIIDMAEARLWWERSASLGFQPAIKALEVLQREKAAGPASARR